MDHLDLPDLLEQLVRGVAPATEAAMEEKVFQGFEDLTDSRDLQEMLGKWVHQGLLVFQVYLGLREMQDHLEVLDLLVFRDKEDQMVSLAVLVNLVHLVLQEQMVYQGLEERGVKMEQRVFLDHLDRMVLSERRVALEHLEPKEKPAHQDSKGTQEKLDQKEEVELQEKEVNRENKERLEKEDRLVLLVLLVFQARKVNGD